MTNQEAFDKWAFEQCVINGHRIDSIKDSKGENIKWVNQTTGEEFQLIEDEEDE